MTMHIPPELILPTLSLLKKLIYSINRKERHYTNSHQYDKFLTDRVFKAKHPLTYRAAIGEGDWVASWISRLNDQAIKLNKKSPMIDKIVIKHLNSKLATEMESMKILRPGFTQSMESNLKTIRDSVNNWNTKVQITTSEWTAMPMFHGHVIDDWTLIGFWLANGNGQLHVKTSLNVYHKSVDESYYRTITKVFE